jgi:hypothetical protein
MSSKTAHNHVCKNVNGRSERSNIFFLEGEVQDGVQIVNNEQKIEQPHVHNIQDIEDIFLNLEDIGDSCIYADCKDFNQSELLFPTDCESFIPTVESCFLNCMNQCMDLYNEPKLFDVDFMHAISLDTKTFIKEFCTSVKGITANNLFFDKNCDVIVSQERFRPSTLIVIPVHGIILYPNIDVQTYTVRAIIRPTDSHDDDEESYLFNEPISLQLDVQNRSVLSSISLTISDNLAEQAMWVNKRKCELQLIIMSGRYSFCSVSFKVYNRNCFSDFKTRELLTRCTYLSIDSTELKRESNVWVRLSCLYGDIFTPKLSAIEVELEHNNNKIRAKVKTVELDGHMAIKLSFKVPRIDITLNNTVKLMIKYVNMPDIILPYTDTKKRKETDDMDDEQEGKKTKLSDNIMIH